MADLGYNLPSGLGNTQASMAPVVGSPEVRPGDHGTRPTRDPKRLTDDTDESQNSDDFFGPPLKPTVSEESSGDSPPRRVSGQLCNYHDMKVVWWDETGRREQLSDVEDVEKYVPGGFHPVDIHDTLQGGRYEVIAKLGHGGYGIVWLCRDLRKNIWRAVKILTARHSLKRTTDWTAVQMLQEAGATQKQWEKAHIQLPIDNFWVEGPNGRHMCLVLPLLGPDLKSIPEAEPHVLKRYLLQIAHGLQFLHKRNIGHGDIRPHNILLKLGNIDHISKREMMALLGPPVKETIRRISNEFPREYAPTYVVEPADISCLPTTNEVAIIDFGVSFRADHRSKRIGIPSQFAAPESLFSCYPGLGADVWAFVCTISDILVGGSLFKGEKSDYLFYLEVLLGPLIEPYRTAFLEEWERSPVLQQKLPNIKKTDETVPWGKLAPLSTTFTKLERYRRIQMDDKGGNVLDGVTNTIVSRHLLKREDVLGNGYPGSTNHLHIFSSDEVRILVDLFGKVLRYDEKERLTINEVIRHTWFRINLDGRDIQHETTKETVPGEIPMSRERTLSEGHSSVGSIPEDPSTAEDGSVSEEIRPSRGEFVSGGESFPEENSVSRESSGSDNGSVSKVNFQDVVEPVALVQEEPARRMSVGSPGVSESTQLETEPVEMQAVDHDLLSELELDPEPIKPKEVELNSAKVDDVRPERTDTESFGVHAHEPEQIESEMGELMKAELDPPAPNPSHMKEPEVSQEEPILIRPPVSRTHTHEGYNQSPASIPNVSVPVEHELAGEPGPNVSNPATPTPTIPEPVTTQPSTPKTDLAKETEAQLHRPDDHPELPAPSPQPHLEPNQPPANNQTMPTPVVSPTPKRRDPIDRTRRIALIAFVSATAVWVVMFAVFLAGARFGGRSPMRPVVRGPCEPGYVFAQTRKLSAHTTFFEGLMTFPEPQTLEDGQECSVFRNMEVESEIVPAQLS
jgi:serine/threonine-protein kinase SRPK3